MNFITMSSIFLQGFNELPGVNEFFLQGLASTLYLEPHEAVSIQHRHHLLLYSYRAPRKLPCSWGRVNAPLRVQLDSQEGREALPPAAAADSYLLPEQVDGCHRLTARDTHRAREVSH